MDVFPLRYPGAQLNGVADVSTAMGQLAVLEYNLSDAAIALDLFKSSRAQIGPPMDYDEAASGMPYGYFRRLPFIYAHVFVYALDAISKTMGVLARSSDFPTTDVQQAYDNFKAAVPDLLSVRNSAHHVEDRIRGMGRGQVPLPTQLRDISNLRDNRLTYTGEDGSVGEVEICKESVEAGQRAIQQIFDALSWSGPAWEVPMPAPGAH